MSAHIVPKGSKPLGPVVPELILDESKHTMESPKTTLKTSETDHIKINKSKLNENDQRHKFIQKLFLKNDGKISYVSVGICSALFGVVLAATVEKLRSKQSTSFTLETSVNPRLIEKVGTLKKILRAIMY